MTKVIANRVFWAVAAAVVLAIPNRADDHSSAARMSPDQALQQLQVGHARFLCGKVDRPHADAERRRQTARDGQHPFAIVLTCSDSRVPVEMLFDQGIGDLFVIRVAGNVCDKHQAGSMEYAFEHLGVPLVVVMGHRSCGAVAAAASKAELHGNVAAVVEPIRPAVEAAEKANPGFQGEALLAEAIRANVYQSMADLLRLSPTLTGGVKQRSLKVVGAVYDIESGSISWMGPHPKESELTGGLVAGETVEQKPAKDDGHAPRSGDAHEGASDGKSGRSQHAPPSGQTPLAPPPRPGAAKPADPVEKPKSPH